MGDVEITRNGTAVSVGVGDEVVVRLPENPTTGYTWDVSVVDEELRLLDSSYLAPGQPDVVAAPGAGGERVIRLRAAAPGTAQVRLSLRRAWEGEAAQTFTAQVRIE